MAKKIVSKKKDVSPYLALIDIEAHGEPRQPVSRGVGRPRKLNKRIRITMTLTKDEIGWIDQICAAMERRMGGNFSRGLLVSFMTVRTYAALTTTQDEKGEVVLPENVDTIAKLSVYLDSFGS